MTLASLLPSHPTLHKQRNSDYEHHSDAGQQRISSDVDSRFSTAVYSLAVTQPKQSAQTPQCRKNPHSDSASDESFLGHSSDLPSVSASKRVRCRGSLLLQHLGGAIRDSSDLLEERDRFGCSRTEQPLERALRELRSFAEAAIRGEFAVGAL